MTYWRNNSESNRIESTLASPESPSTSAYARFHATILSNMTHWLFYIGIISNNLHDVDGRYEPIEAFFSDIPYTIVNGVFLRVKPGLPIPVDVVPVPHLYPLVRP